LAKERLNYKQKEILKYLSSEAARFKTTTSIVKDLAKILNCSESALFNNVNSLKRSGLVENELGKPLKLTKIGKLILKEVMK
jgi:Mn-dependent DtxR family transcriptional regulator